MKILKYLLKNLVMENMLNTGMVLMREINDPVEMY